MSMTIQQLAKALKKKKKKLDIISIVTAISEERLEEIINSEDMTQQEYIVLYMHC
jgi:hypothetical protein